MSSKRRNKISACYSSFIKEIERLEKFDSENHSKFSANAITKPQLELMVESIFFTSYRAYENFIREVFILYTLGKQNKGRIKVKSYLNPKSFEHAEALIRSSMPFLDWSDPEKMIERASLYLKNGYPIRLIYTSHTQELRNFKKLRNHIAHDSIESSQQFTKVVQSYYHGVRPISLPTAGQYLMLTSRTRSNSYILLDFFHLLKTISHDLT